MSGVAQRTEREVVESLEVYFQGQGSRLRPAREGELAEKMLIVDCSEQGHVSIRGWDFIDEQGALTRHLSESLGVPAFHFHLHDGDLWMYELYANGQEVDRFCTRPDYWGELPPQQKNGWRGRAAVVCEHWPEVREDGIENYLAWWDDLNAGHKAYPDDEYDVSSEGRQLCDVIRKLGLVLPEGEDGRCLIVEPIGRQPITSRMELGQLVVALVGTEEREERDQVVSILRGRDEQDAALQRLRELLAAGHPDERPALARAMADLALPEAIEVLLPFLEEESWRIRSHVGVALVRLGERERAMPVLEALLLDKEGPNAKQIRAALAIGNYGVSSQLRVLQQAAELHALDPTIQHVLEIAVTQLKER